MKVQALLYRQWTEYIRLYLDNIDVKASSRKVYTKALNQWLYFIKNAEASSNTNIVLRYKQSLIERNLSPYTICVYLNAVKNLFQYLEESRIIECNTAKSIRIKKPRSTRQALTKNEVLKLLHQKSVPSQKVPPTPPLRLNKTILK